MKKFSLNTTNLRKLGQDVNGAVAVKDVSDTVTATWTLTRACSVVRP